MVLVVTGRVWAAPVEHASGLTLVIEFLRRFCKLCNITAAWRDSDRVHVAVEAELVVVHIQLGHRLVHRLDLLRVVIGVEGLHTEIARLVVVRDSTDGALFRSALLAHLGMHGEVIVHVGRLELSRP